MQLSILRAARFALLAMSSIALYFGLGMLLLVPGDPGGPYWVKERVVYGLLPLSTGALLLAFSSWLAILYCPRVDPVALIKRNLLYAAIGIVLVFVLLVINDSYFHLPLHIASTHF